MAIETGMLVGNLLYQAARRCPNRPAVKEGKQALTYREWNERVNAVAHCMAGQLGVAKGDRAAVFSHNSLDMLTAAFAIQKLGAIYVSINFRLAEDELRYQLEDAGVKVLFYDVELVDVVRPAAKDIDALVGLNKQAKPRVPLGIPFEDLCGGVVDEPRADIADADTSLIMYTSGTTGRPKGVELSHRAQWINTVLCAVELGLKLDDRTLHMAPLFHVAAYHVMLLPHVLVGGFNVILRRFDPENVLGLLEREQLTTMLGVPTQYDRIADFLQIRTAACSALRLAVTTGAPIKRQTADQIRDRLAPSLCGVYGLTESTSLLCILSSDEWDRRPEGCIGRSLIGVETRVLSIQDELDLDSTVAPGTPGMLVAKTPKLMDGYLHNPAKTGERIKEGWLITGDVVIADADGFFRLVDRYDDMIISGGENVYPQEVEQVLLRCPGVADCAVVGVPDPQWGQVIKAFVVAHDPELIAETVDAFCLSGRIARYKRPRVYEFVEVIPRNPSGKILRKRLRGACNSSTKVNSKEVQNG